MTETVNTTSGELVTIEDDASQPVATLAEKLTDMMRGGTAGILSTIQGEGFEPKLAALAAMDSSEPISEHLKKTINVANIIVQPIVMKNEDTGEMEAQPRVIFIESNGKAYHGISNVLFRAVQNWVALLGQPKDWPEGFTLPIQVFKEGTGQRQFFNAKLAK